MNQEAAATDGVKDGTNQADSSAVSPNPEAEQKASGQEESHLKLLPTWLKVFLVVLPLLSFILSIASFFISFDSLRFAKGYIRPYQDHEVVARVLGVIPHMKGFSTNIYDSAVHVDLALINQGNQPEIIRDAVLCYSDSKDFGNGTIWEGSSNPMNIQLDKGARRVLRVVMQFGPMNTGKRKWLGIRVRAIAPNSEEIACLWPVCEIDLAPDGNGAWVSYDQNKAPQIQIISNQRMPHQRPVQDGF